MTLLRIYQVVHQFDVHKRSAQVHAVAAENILLVFKVVAVFCYAFVSKHILELFCVAFGNETFKCSVSGNCYSDLLYFCKYTGSVSFSYDSTLSLLCRKISDLL